MTYQIKIPDSAGVNDFDLKMIVASKLFEEGKLSSGQASEIVGVSKRTFIELLGKYGVPMFNYKHDDLTDDILNA